MTTPDVPLRMELTFEMPGTPAQVWDAIATANGISSWFLPTDLDGRLGGTIVTHMGETSSPGTVTGWDPPRRFAYEEPDWAGLAGQASAPVTPLATEFLVEATSGGSCVVRVVTSAFGTGAEWEREFFDEMEKGWTPSFDRLRLYLQHFPGQQVTAFAVERNGHGDAAPLLATMRTDLGIGAPGDSVEVRGLTGTVARVGDNDLLLLLTEPLPGFLGVSAWDYGDEVVNAVVHGQLFSDQAPAFVAEQEPLWQAWLDGIVPAGSSAAPAR